MVGLKITSRESILESGFKTREMVAEGRLQFGEKKKKKLKSREEVRSKVTIRNMREKGA